MSRYTRKHKSQRDRYACQENSSDTMYLPEEGVSCYYSDLCFPVNPRCDRVRSIIRNNPKPIEGAESYPIPGGPMMNTRAGRSII